MTTKLWIRWEEVENDHHLIIFNTKFDHIAAPMGTTLLKIVKSSIDPTLYEIDIPDPYLIFFNDVGFITFTNVFDAKKFISEKMHLFAISIIEYI